jgi:hypothetical protein
MDIRLLFLMVGFLQKRVIRAIFASLIQDRPVELDDSPNDETALSVARSVLWRHPDWSIAIVLETRSEDPQKIRETYVSTCRWLRRSPASGWHLALAIPSLQTWALLDDHVRQEYAKIHQDPSTASTPEERAKIELMNFAALATKIGEWVKEKPFDLETLKRESRQVRELCTFIEKSLQPKPEPEPEPVTAADWF